MVYLGDDVAGGNNVVYADECCAVAIGYNGQCAESDMGDLLDGFGFHVAVSDSCTGWHGANIGFPFWRGHEESARGGCYHCSAVEDCIGVVRGGMDILYSCLCTRIVLVKVGVSSIVR